MGEFKKKKPTIYDIAKLSGVSPKTVSRVVNGGEKVKRSTYEKVKKILDEYNYVPNTYAQSLITKRINNILISVKKTQSYPLKWFSILLERIILECRKHNLNVIVEYVENGATMEDSILYASSSFVGAAIIFYESEDDERIRLLKKFGIPFVVFGKSYTDGVIYVTNDDYGSLKSLYNYLYGQGFKKMLMLMGNKTNTNMERARGALDACRELGLPEDTIEVVYSLKTIDDVYQFSKQYFASRPPVEVVFVSGDEKVIGLIHALNELGIRIPDDVSVVGFDNIPIAEHYTPPLTTIAQDYATLSREIVERIVHLIEGRHDLESVEVPTWLIVRNSVKPRA